MIKWQPAPWIYQVLTLRSVRLAREANFASMERTEGRVFFVAEDPFFALAFENRSKWLSPGFRPGCSNNAFEIDFVGLRAHYQVRTLATHRSPIKGTDPGRQASHG